MAESTLSSKGQITLPKAVRDRLHLEPGDKVLFDIRDDGSVIIVARNEPLEKLFGMLKGKAKRRTRLRIEEMDPASGDE